MIDYSLKYCTYETRFSNGFYYRGKAITKNVLAGTYTGSGTRYKLTVMHIDRLNSNPLNPPDYEQITRVTTVHSTHATESEAYAQEALFVPLELLFDPFILNDTEGGAKGKFRTRNTIMKQIMSEKKKAVREKKAAKAKEMKQQLKRLQNATKKKPMPV